MATTRTREEIDREAEENRKRGSISFNSLSLPPNFNPSNVTQKQVSKLQELHKRRMQIKANSKIHKKPKGKALFLSLLFISYPVKTENAASKNSQSIAIEDGESFKKLKESTLSSSSTLEHQHNKTLVTAPKKPHKLFWGARYKGKVGKESQHCSDESISRY